MIRKSILHCQQQIFIAYIHTHRQALISYSSLHYSTYLSKINTDGFSLYTSRKKKHFIFPFLAFIRVLKIQQGRSFVIPINCLYT